MTIPFIDLSTQTHRQILVDRELGQYLGRPSTCLLEAGLNLLCVYSKGHGQGPIVLKRSLDGGLTWSERLPTPASWITSLETPTLHRVVDAAGVKRLVLWSGLYPARLSVSEDDGNSWSEFKPAGVWGGMVVMSSLAPMRNVPGQYVAMSHDDGHWHAPGVENVAFR